MYFLFKTLFQEVVLHPSHPSSVIIIIIIIYLFIIPEIMKCYLLGNLNKLIPTPDLNKKF